MSSNYNLPPIPVYIHNKFLIDGGKKSTYEHFMPKKSTFGHLVSVRSLYGQALQFSVLLENGALFTGLPANSICFKENSKILTLQEAQMYDCIGDDIEVFTIETLRYAKCTVKTDLSIYKGKYLFTIDFVGKTGLSYHPEQWKQFHCVQTYDGNLLIYPQYRLKFLDKGLCPKSNEKFPKYKANRDQWIIGS